MVFKRRERDSNPRYTLGVYTLSRRASSTTRASLQFSAFVSSKTSAKYEKIPICKRFSAQIYSFCLTYTQYLVDKF